MQKYNSAFTALLIIFLFIFIGLQLGHHFILGTDTFYHAKMANLYADGKNLTDFPWLNQTDFNGSFADKSWLFHLAISPFTLIQSPWGLKIFIILTQLLLLFSFYLLLKSHKIKHKSFWLIILLISSTYFLLRIQYLRPLLLNIPFSLIGLYLLNLKQKKWLFIWSLAFILLSYGSLLIIGLMITAWLASYLIINKKIDWRGLIFACFGTLAGFLLHPGRQNYLRLLKQNYLAKALPEQIGLLLPRELEPLKFFEFIQTSYLLLIALVISVVILIIFLKFLNKSSVKNNLLNQRYLTLLFIVLAFLILTIKSVRFIEYLTPFLILLTAYGLKLLFNNFNDYQLERKIKTFLKNRLIKIVLIIALFSLITYPLIICFKNYTTYDYSSGYKETALWLKTNTPEHSVVFHVSWDAFPRLFYWNHYNYYLVGLDPVFMYLHNPQNFWLWRHLTEDVSVCDQQLISDCGQIKNAPAEIAKAIRENFDSEYIWVNNYPIYEDFKNFLNANPEWFEKKIETDDSAVYQIKVNR